METICKAQIRKAIEHIVAYLHDEEKDYASRAQDEKRAHVWHSVDLLRDALAKGEFNSGDGGGEPPKIDPIIQRLLSRLPKSGDVWPEEQRKLWLQLLEGSFRLIYKDKTEVA
jgi:hypothetical protein